MSFRQRTTRPQVWSHPRFLKMPRAARLCFLELVGLADDWGRLQCTPIAIWRARYADDEDHGHPEVTKADVAKLLDAVEAQGWIRRYEHDGCTYAQIVGWSTKDHPAHQVVDYPSKIQAIPPPPEAREGLASPTRGTREAPAGPSREPLASGGVVGGGGLASDQDRDQEEEQDQDPDPPYPPSGGEPPLVEVEVEVPEPEPKPVQAVRVDGPMALSGSSVGRMGLGQARPLSSELDTPTLQAVTAVLDTYRTFHPTAFRQPPAVDSKEVQAILARLGEGHTTRELVRAIEAGHMDSEWHAGHNPKGAPFVRLTTLLASSSVVTELLELAATPREEREKRKKSNANRPARHDHTEEARQRAADFRGRTTSDDIPF